MRPYKLCCRLLKTNNGPHISIYALSYSGYFGYRSTRCLLRYIEDVILYIGTDEQFLIEYHHLPSMHDVIKTISIGSIQFGVYIDL